MAGTRASKGFLVEPSSSLNIPETRRQQWLDDASKNFVARSPSNKQYYLVLLERIWPAGHGIPGPIVTQDDLRNAVDKFRESQGKGKYKDVFRRVRELQGEEGYTCIIKEGIRYQLQNLSVGSKREPRVKPKQSMWNKIKEHCDYRCTHCGVQEPDAKLSPDHRVPRARGGSNDEENWQPLCEQCNIRKSSSCQGCQLNCYTCSWAYPEIYKPIIIADDNKEQIRRMSEKSGKDQSGLVNEILRTHFNINR